MLRDMKIGKRLAVGFALIFLVSLASSLVSIWRLHDVATTTHEMMHTPLAKERMISDWYRATYGSIRRNMAIAKSSDTSLDSFFAKDAADALQLATDMQNRIAPLLQTDREKALYTALIDARGKYAKSRDALKKAKKEGKNELASKMLDETFVPAAKEYELRLRDLLDAQRTSIDHVSDEIDAAEFRTRNALIMMAVLSMLAGGLVALLLTLSITRPLASALRMARFVADGDLTASIRNSAKDEPGQLLDALDQMSVTLRGIVAQVRTGSDMIEVASSEVAAGNIDLSARTEEQAASLEQTSATMGSLTQTVRNNSSNAREVDQLARVASEVALRGSMEVAEVVATMAVISSSAEQIVNIIGVIDSIAFQTNILALNAAVEAARVGEQGKGFAVVASEVRGLAHRSASAAQEIKALIGDSVGKVDTGTYLVERAGKTILEMVENIKHVQHLVGEISSASQTQSISIEEVNQAILQIDTVTQQNAALVEEAAAASSSLKEHCVKLTQIVSIFKIGTIG